MTPVVELGFSAPPDTRFGYGAIESLGDSLQGLGVRRPFLIIDAAIRKSPSVGEALRLAGRRVFEGMRPNTTEADVAVAATAFAQSNADGIVAIGGGSVIDGAKLVGLVARQGGPLAQYDMTVGGAERITQDLPPLVVVPSTSGSGSEVGRAALVVVGGKWKVVVRSSHLMPRMVILDPSITQTVPPAMTAATGMDALSHGIEASLVDRPHPVIDLLIAEAIRLVHRHLARAAANGDDREARAGMMLAAYLAGFGFQKGLGAVHALSHPLASHGAHHGTANSILMPHVIAFNAGTVPERVAAIAELVGVESLSDWVTHLAAACGLPSRLSEIGIARSAIPVLAQRAVIDPAAQTNPRSLSVADAIDIYERAH